MKFIIIAMLLLICSVVTSAQVGADNAVANVNQKKQTGIYYDAEQEAFYIDDSAILAFGGYGSTLITGTTTAVGTYFSIQVLADAVVDSLVDAGRDGDAVSSLALTAGTIIYGQNITRIKLASGIVIAYKRKVQP